MAQLYTQLQTAIEQGNLERTRTLLAGSKANATLEEDGVSLLHHACMNGKSEIVKLLIATGANVNAKNPGGWTPLHCTSQLDIAQILVDKGANIHDTNLTGDTAFHNACAQDSMEVAEYLLQKGARIDPSPTSSPLHHACFHKNERLVKQLVDLGAPLNSADENGLTPLHLATMAESLPIVSLLIGKGANAQAVDVNNKTALEIAVENKSVQIAKFLADKQGIPVPTLSSPSPSPPPSNFSPPPATFSPSPSPNSFSPSPSPNSFSPSPSPNNNFPPAHTTTSSPPPAPALSPPATTTPPPSTTSNSSNFTQPSYPPASTVTSASPLVFTPTISPQPNLSTSAPLPLSLSPLLGTSAPPPLSSSSPSVFPSPSVARTFDVEWLAQKGKQLEASGNLDLACAYFLVASNEESDKLKSDAYKQWHAMATKNLVENVKKREKERAAEIVNEIGEIDKQIAQGTDSLLETASLKAQKEKLQLEKLTLREPIALAQENAALKKSLEVVERYGLTPEKALFKKFLSAVKQLDTKKLRCFISYAWNGPDTLEALQGQLQRIKGDLVETGIEVMLDIHNMEGDIDKYMLDGIQSSDKVLMIYTPKFVERAAQTLPNGEQNNLQKELNAALARQKVDARFIIPLMLEGDFKSSVAKNLPNILFLDFSNPNNYYTRMTSLAPKGLIPMLLGLEKNEVYLRLLEGFQHELKLLALERLSM